MSRNKKLITGAIGVLLCICVLAITVFAIIFFRPSLLNPRMPVFEYDVVPSSYEGYSRHTLTRDGITYEMDYADYGLWTNGYDLQIGQTPLGGRIYSIPGQENYVVLYDFMSPIGVFRNIRILPFDWRTASYNEMRLYSTVIATATPNESKVSTDLQLIQDALSPMLGNATAISADEANGSPRGFALYLYNNEQLAGMSYGLGVYIDELGQVYVAENTFSKEWFPASEAFSEWAKSQ